MGDQLNAIFFQVVQSGSGGVGTCTVVVEQQATGAGVWTAYVPSLKDLGKRVLKYHSTLSVFLF